ncbi:hypothetical protein RPMA_02415 [Tardiphaga alba]|uniref:Cytochrome c domain-containing protein n=1 Tax=Tardiphaga alba TaxID=340268 RepID=A0ABX8A619_9BRAD|nr:cytochrome c peroxidase [Tardiphaga alba]QUS37840.1 hypothetical protein RPMA_02415 [Tardiphaga alba]
MLRLLLNFGLFVSVTAFFSPSYAQAPASTASLDQRLIDVLRTHSFEGKEGQKLQARLERDLDTKRVELGRSLFFDKILAVGNDNTCSGCHAPLQAFGDSQSIAIGVQNNNKVGPDRAGPRNMRRTPGLLNIAFYPRLMWNTRFNALSDDPFDGSKGFEFPNPENTNKFAAFDEYVRHLLVAQGHMPPTEFQEMAGFGNTEGKSFRVSRLNGAPVQIRSEQVNALARVMNSQKTMATNFTASSSAPAVASPLPDADSTGTINEPVRRAVLGRLHESSGYRRAFQEAFPEIKDRSDINFAHVGAAIAEFEISLNFADAPIDQFARGNRNALTDEEKRGALIFFGSGKCVSCHAVQGSAREMFSDFRNHAIGVPPLLSSTHNMPDGNFKGPNKNEDFGREDITNSQVDRYQFRTSPLRNVSLQPTFFHNGAYTKLDDAIRHHLNAEQSLRSYDRAKAGVAADIDQMGPIDPVAAAIDPLLKAPINLKADEFADLVAFVKNGLTDKRATGVELCKQIPGFVLSGIPMHEFQGCAPN